MALTDREVQAVKPGEWLSDGPAGTGRGSGVLLFRRTSAGAVLAYFRYTLPDGSRDTLPIGGYDKSGRDGMRLAEARTRAGELSRLYQSGVKDIRGHFEAERAARGAAQREAEAARMAADKQAEERQRYNLAALCAAYVGHLETQGKTKSAAETQSAFKCHVLPHTDIASKPAREVTADDITLIVRKIRESGKERTAGITRSYLSAAFGVAKRARHDTSLPADLIPFRVDHNPVVETVAIPVRAGKRALSVDELQHYIRCLGDTLPDVALRVALLAGGQRAAQLLRVQVRDYDVDAQALQLWDSKGKRVEARRHVLPLGPKAAALVTDLVDRARSREKEAAEAEERKPDFAGQWLFSSRGHVHLTETTLSKRVKEIATEMKGESFDLRDIRRTCETQLVRMGISKDIRAQLLSHGISGVQDKHYDQHDYLPEKRAALVAWERKLAEIEKNKKLPGNVQQIRKSA